jgi:hypothetical protein
MKVRGWQFGSGLSNADWNENLEGNLKRGSNIVRQDLGPMLFAT